VKVSKAEQIAFTQNTKISTRIASKVVLLIDVKKGFLLFLKLFFGLNSFVDLSTTFFIHVL